MREPSTISTVQGRCASQWRRESRSAVRSNVHLMLAPAAARCLLCGCATPRPVSSAASMLRQGVVNADDFETLQAAVDALAPAGGIVQLSSRTYDLLRPLRI